MGSKGGPRAVQAPYSGSETSNQTSTNNFSSTANSTVPDWVRNAGQDLYGRGTNFLDQWAVNPYLQQAGQGASAIGAGAPNQVNVADWLLNQDRGGGYATQAIEELMRYGGTSGGGQFGSGAAGTTPNRINRGDVRDVAWRDFTDYDVDAYMNPYTQNVVDASVGDVQRQADVERLRRSGAAHRGGTFGSSGHAI